MGIEWWFAKVWEGGAYCAVLELAAILWLLKDRATLVADLRATSAKVENLAERLMVVTTELRVFLFNERKA